MTPKQAQEAGSSPLTRGAQRARCVALRPRGLIPAHAGSTTTQARALTAPTAHPRSRGEHPHKHVNAEGREGSSPLTRGAQTDGDLLDDLLGLIPAHAGSTPSSDRTPHAQTAHPRSRGEHARRSAIFTSPHGSSPLTRGAPGRCRRGRRRCGLIPAHAGSTTTRATSCAQTGAHPRSRGEHSSASAFQSTVRGSSPLTRGAHCFPPRHLARPRLIPAHAGSTGWTTTPKSPRGAHPRSRGEHD